MEPLDNTFVLRPINLLPKKCRRCNGFSGRGQPEPGCLCQWLPAARLTRAADSSEQRWAPAFVCIPLCNSRERRILPYPFRWLKPPLGSVLQEGETGGWGGGGMDGCCSPDRPPVPSCGGTAWNRSGLPGSHKNRDELGTRQFSKAKRLCHFLSCRL